MSAYTDYFKAVKGCSEGAQKALMTVWNSLDFSKPALCRDILLEMLPAIVERYGNAAATAAAEMYEAVMLAEKGYMLPAIMAEANLDMMTNSVRYAAGHLFRDAAPTALQVLMKSLDYYVKQTARETVEQTAYRDRKEGARYARVPQGPTTCEFCVMLASRGFVYKTKSTAGDGYHTDCDCVPVVSFVDEPEVEGYDPDYWYDQYRQMKDKDKWNKARQAKKDRDRM